MTEATDTKTAPGAGRIAIGLVVTAAAAVGAWLGLAQTLPAWGERLLVIGLPVYLLGRVACGALPRTRGDWAYAVVLALLVPGLVAAGAHVLAGALGGVVVWPEVGIAALFGLSALSIAYAVRALAIGLTSIIITGRAARAIVAGLLTVVVALPFLAATVQAHRIKIGNGAGPDVDHETVSFETEDGLTISGWLLPGRSASAGAPGPGIVFVHGLSANRGNFADLAGIPHAMGYTVLIFDLRGHGDSDGHSVSFGPREALDVAAAARFLAARPEVDGDRIAAIGCSLGSAAALHAAAKDPALFKGLFLDSPFADVDLLADHIYGYLPPAVRRPFLEGMFLAGRIETGGRDLREQEPQDVAPKVTAPIVLIHGRKDPLIPVEQSGMLHEALTRAGNEPRLEVFDEAEHVAAFNAEPARYHQVLARFLSRTIGAP